MAVAMQYGSNEYNRSGGASGGGGISMTLLWTNPDDTVNFAAQKISLDLSSYGAIGIVPRFGVGTRTIMPMQIFEIDDGTEHNMITIQSASYNRTGGRAFTVDSTGVDFEGGNYNGSSGNNYALPIKIYGIRGIG